MVRSVKVVFLVVYVFLSMLPLAACSPFSMEKGKVDVSSMSAEKYSGPKITIKIFMSDVGRVVPNDVKVDDNEYINFIKNKFNVDIVIDKPSYQDFLTKYDLLLSSGDLPEIVHALYNTKVDVFGKKGAFIPLNRYIEGSPVFKGMYDRISLYAATADDGNIYGIPQFNPNKVYISSCVARTDLIDELNNGVIPATPDEWYEVMLKEKKKYPSSIPFTCNNDFYTGTVFFQAYGVLPNYNNMPYFTIEPDGRVLTNFEKPEYRQAILFYKKLYDNGLMDRDFATNDSGKRVSTVNTKKTICFNTSPDQMAGYLPALRRVDPDGMYQYVPQPVAPGVDPIRTLNNKVLPISAHRVSISSSCKNPDRVFAILEYMASQEWKDIIYWGFKGEGYTEQSGNRVLNMDNYLKESYRRIYGFIAGYNEVPEVVNAFVIQQYGIDVFKKCFDSISIANSEGEKRGYYPFVLKPSFAGVDEKDEDAFNYIISASTKAITSAITMEEFDKLVKDYKKQFGNITEADAKWWNNNKDKVNYLLK